MLADNSAYQCEEGKREYQHKPVRKGPLVSAEFSVMPAEWGVAQRTGRTHYTEYQKGNS